MLTVPAIDSHARFGGGSLSLASRRLNRHHAGSTGCAAAIANHPMPHSEPLFESSIPTLTLAARGKVRDIYAIDDEHLLIVTTDRLSAYDVIMPNPVPGKGEVLTRISNFWFAMMTDIIPNHLTGRSLDDVIADPVLRRSLEARSIVCRRLQPLPIEAVVRGYLIGSGWRDYQASGQVCGISLPVGLEQASRLPDALFTPATKAEAGNHDQNISFDQTARLIGNELASRVRECSMRIYRRAAEHALKRGIIIADTKLEFGLDDKGTLYLIDEVLTPDSSRFWPLAGYRTGISPPSFDKQFVRDYLDTLDWDKTAPGPGIPPDILNKTAEKYREAFRILTGPSW
jgi:phosphoribosylaminoimidazole-succinocarboxamide synthase